jgi:Symplekin/PTA1 N-terminal
MAVINALGPLVKTRHTLSSKIINIFLSVDIVSIPRHSPDPTKAQLQLRSVSKTIRIQLSHFLRYLFLRYSNFRTNAAGPLSNRIDQYLRTSQLNGIAFDGEEISRKRPASTEDDFSQPSKRLRADSEGPSIQIDPSISLAFLLDPANPLALYDAQVIPLTIVTEIIIRTLEILPHQLLEDRLNVLPCIIYLTVACSCTIINITYASSK